MAEVLGVVAGGAGLASLAIQLIESSFNIARLFNSYKEAPKRLQDISEDLENFALTLYSIGRERQHRKDTNRDVMERCVQLCDRTAARVSAAVAKLELTMQTSSVKGRILTAFSQTRILQLCDDLERAKSSLVLVLQLYSAACQRDDAIRMLEELGKSISTLQQVKAYVVEPPIQADGGSDPSALGRRHQPGRTGKRMEFEVVPQIRCPTDPGRRQCCPQSWRIRLRPWFARRKWEVSITIAQSGFNINLQTCNFVPPDALIFDACEGGDIAEVQALFSSGQASPFDCCYITGQTVLSAAAWSGNLQLCRYLINAAGFPARPNNSLEAINGYAMYCYCHRKEGITEAAEMYRLLLKQPGVNVETDILSGGYVPSLSYAPNHACMKLVREEFCLTPFNFTWEARTKEAILMGKGAFQPQALLELHGYGTVNPHIARACDVKGITALHVVARNLTYSDLDDFPALVDFVRQLLLNGADIHRKCKAGSTPFAEILLNYSNIEDRTECAQYWVRLLQAADVDLLAYGMNEVIVSNASSPRGYEDRLIKIQSWTYGACVEDWTVEYFLKFSIPVYDLTNAPGAWPPLKEQSIDTIAWYPEDEDDLDSLLRWSWRQDITLASKPSSPAVRSDVYNKSLSLSLNTRRDLDDAQDDCRAVMRVIENSSKASHRPRSCSQPRELTFGQDRGVRHWMPSCHVCSEDGRLKLGFARERRCAKGIHAERHHFYARIKQQTRRFQLRYRDVNELRSLPYTAYHPTWKRQSPAT